MELNVQHNIDQAIARLRTLSPRQAPFIISKALNAVAKDVQQSVKDSLPGSFTIRNNWTAKGIRFKGSSKDNLTAEVYTKDYYMKRQQYGGEKGNQGGSYQVGSSFTGVDSKGRRYRRISAPGMVAVPMPDLKRTGRGIVRGRDTPKGLGNKGFVIKSGANTYLAVRTGRGKNKQVKLYYHLRNETKVLPKLKMDVIGQKVVARRFNKHLEDAIAFAFASLDRRRGA